MKLIETQSKATLVNWAIDYAEEVVIDCNSSPPEDSIGTLYSVLKMGALFCPKILTSAQITDKIVQK